MKQTEIPDRIDKATGTDTPAPLLIRHAVPEDFPAILAIYARARAFMKAHGNPRQWNDTWPPETLLREDIRLGRMYVAVAADEIAAVFVYIQGVDIDPSYRLIENGAWGNPGEYGVVHRLAGSGNVRGVGEYCLNWPLPSAITCGWIPMRIICPCSACWGSLGLPRGASFMCGRITIPGWRMTSFDKKTAYAPEKIVL